jgi:flagellar biosynthesis anti-sigma factor FlgM
MKVQSNAIQAYARTALNPATAPTVQPQVADTSAVVNNDEAAQVTISAQARELAAQRGGIDQQKVDSLKAAVNSGELRINPQILALRILDSFG